MSIKTESSEQKQFIMMAAIGAILKAVSQGDLDKGAVVAMATSIAGCMLAMSKAMSIISDIVPSWKTFLMNFGTLVEGLGSVAVISEILQRNSQGTDWKQVVGMAVGISVVLIAVAVVAKIASTIGTAAKEAAIGLVAIAAFVSALSSALIAMGVLYDEGLQKVVQNGGKFFIDLAEIIGNVIGAFVEGTVDKMSESLPVIGENLAKFMENANPFFEGLAKLDNNLSKKAITMSNVIYKNSAKFAFLSSLMFGKSFSTIDSIV